MNSESQVSTRANLNIFDDDVSDEEFKLSIIQRVNIDDDTEEIVNLDGTTVGYKTKDRLLPAATSGKSSPGSNDHACTMSNISDHLSDSMWDDWVMEDEKKSTKEEVASLEMTIRNLQLYKVRSELDRFTPLAVNDTIERLTHMQPYTLELYTSKADKLALIDRALQVHDGNAIITVTLFLKQTLAPRLFISEMKKRPQASKHYVSYLASRFAHQEMLDFYQDMDEYEEKAMLEYMLALSEGKTVDTRITNLQTCYRRHFRDWLSLSHEAHLLQEHIALLERQRPIEAADAETERSGKVSVFRSNPRKSSIINMSVITTLYYCSLYHYDKTENHLACPASIKKQHQLTEKEYFWPVLSARSRLKCWLDVEGLMTTKGWFGSTKLRPVIGFGKVASVLYKTGAPSVIVGKYLRLVDNSDERLSLAKTYECHDVVIDTLVSMKNRDELEVYQSKLNISSPEYFYARDALNNSLTRWKP